MNPAATGFSIVRLSKLRYERARFATWRCITSGLVRSDGFRRCRARSMTSSRRTSGEVAERRDIRIVEMQTAFDHIHLLLDIRVEQNLSIVMHDLKGATARAVFLRFPDLRMDMESNSFWQKSFGFRRVPPEQVRTVRQYVRNSAGKTPPPPVTGNCRIHPVGYLTLNQR
jgi:REP element-mobilizing transposase RayT